MKRVTFVFDSPNLEDMVFDVSDGSARDTLSDWDAHLAGSTAAVRIQVLDGIYHLRSNLIAYLKMSDIGGGR